MNNENLEQFYLLHYRQFRRTPKLNDKFVLCSGANGTVTTVPGLDWSSIDQLLFRRKIQGQTAFSLRGYSQEFFKKHDAESIEYFRNPFSHVGANLLQRLIHNFFIKEFRTPYAHDELVWMTDNADAAPHIVTGLTWEAIDSGLRGLSKLCEPIISDLGPTTLSKFIKQSGLWPTRQLSLSIINGYLLDTFKATGKWLTAHDKEVYSFDKKTSTYVKVAESGKTLDEALRYGYRGLSAGSSLSKYKQNLQLGSKLNLDEAGIVQLIKLFFEVQGRLPSVRDKVVYKKCPDSGEVMSMHGLTWQGINTHIIRRAIGLTDKLGNTHANNSSLAFLKTKHFLDQPQQPIGLARGCSANTLGTRG
jgi:hypothetical protein